MQELYSTSFASTFDYVQQWGNHASFLLLERPCKIFTLQTVQGAIGYHQHKRTFVVFGDPLCAADNRLVLVEAFQAYAQQVRCSVIYLNVSQEFVDWFLHYFKGKLIGIGHEFIINPQRALLTETGPHACQLRQKYNKSTRAHIQVHEYCGNDIIIEKKIQQLADSWQQHRKGPQAFFYSLNIFDNNKGKRWFYAQQENRIIGLLTMNQIAHGWVVNMVICTPDALNSCSAFMILKVAETLRHEGSAVLSAGILADSTLGIIKGINPIKIWLARKIYKLCNTIVKLDKRKQFWLQFKPQQKPAYLLASSSFGIKEGLAIMHALHMFPKKK